MKAKVKVQSQQIEQVMAEVLRKLWYQDSVCAICGSEGGPVCGACLAGYFHPDLVRCRNCGKLIPEGQELCQDCRAGRGPVGLEKCTALGHYVGSWKAFIWEVKFRAQPQRLAEIAKPLSQWALHELPPADGIVPVPLHSQRLLERGFNQAEIIASLLHWELGMPLISHGLIRLEQTVSQVGLSRRERLQNLQSAFAVEERKAVQGRDLWLVDDVTTTGATLEACTHSLKKAGARHIYGLCLAAGKELVPDTI